MKKQISSIAFALSLVWVSAANATDIVYRCSEVQGTIIAAPNWQPFEDGFDDRSILLQFSLDGTSQIIGFDGIRYPGVGFSINGGFAIVVIGTEFIETYVVNVANQELMMAQVRSGSALFPNSAKAFRGTCRPARNEVQP